MLLVDQILMVASVLRDGQAGAYHQQLSCRQLQRIADDVRRLEEMADGIVGQAQSEAALAAVPLHRKPRFRLVVSQ
jgi:proline dehydrogenase